MEIHHTIVNTWKDANMLLNVVYIIREWPYHRVAQSDCNTHRAFSVREKDSQGQSGR